jgi:hypothetical protein
MPKLTANVHTPWAPAGHTFEVDHITSQHQHFIDNEVLTLADDDAQVSSEQTYEPGFPQDPYDSALKDDLIKEAEARGIDSSGTKAEIAARLSEDDKNPGTGESVGTGADSDGTSTSFTGGAPA